MTKGLHRDLCLLPLKKHSHHTPGSDLLLKCIKSSTQANSYLRLWVLVDSWLNTVHEQICGRSGLYHGRKPRIQAILLLQYPFPLFTLRIAAEEQSWDRAARRRKEAAAAFLADGTNTYIVCIHTRAHTCSPDQTMMENLPGVQRSHLAVLTSQDLHGYH